MTRKHIGMIARQLGLGAVILDLGKVDYTRGSMQTGPRERVFWTTDGCKVTISMDDYGGIIASKSKEPDADMPGVAFPGYDGR